MAETLLFFLTIFVFITKIVETLWSFSIVIRFITKIVEIYYDTCCLSLDLPLEL